MAPKLKIKAATIDEYLAAAPAEQRATLAKIRRSIQAAVPKAEECISYGLPAFRFDGRPLVAFGAGADHCSFFPMSSNTVADHKSDLAGYDTSKGTIRFPIGQPLPAALVKKLVKARIAENAKRKVAASGNQKIHRRKQRRSVAKP